MDLKNQHRREGINAGLCVNDYDWAMTHRREPENNLSCVNLLHSSVETTQGLRNDFID